MNICAKPTSNLSICHIDWFQANHSRGLDHHFGHLSFACLYGLLLDTVMFVLCTHIKTQQASMICMVLHQCNQSIWKLRWGHHELRDSLDYIVNFLLQEEKKKSEKDVIRDLHVRFSHFKGQVTKVQRIDSVAQIPLISLSHSSHSLGITKI